MEEKYELKNTDWDELIKIVDALADVLDSNKATPRQTLLSSLMISTTVLINSVKEELLEDKNEYLSQLLLLSEKVLEKSGVVRK